MIPRNIKKRIEIFKTSILILFGYFDLKCRVGFTYKRILKDGKKRIIKNSYSQIKKIIN